MVVSFRVVHHHLPKRGVVEFRFDPNTGKFFEHVAGRCPVLDPLKISMETHSDGFIVFMNDGTAAAPGNGDRRNQSQRARPADMNRVIRASSLDSNSRQL